MAVKCWFPNCEKDVVHYERACVDHSWVEYKDFLKLREENERLKRQTTTSAAKYKGGVKIAFYPLIARPPYKIKTKGDYEFIVESQSETGVWTKTERLPDKDLFIHFSELTDTASYLDFVSQYGLFGLRYFKSSDSLPEGAIDFRYRNRPGLLSREAQAANERISFAWSKCPDNEEPLTLIKSFCGEIRYGFDKARDFKSLTEDEQENFRLWLANLLDDTRVFVHKADRTALTLGHTTLAGAIALQLYRFFTSRKELRVCQLPGCQNLTTRTKYCSEKHQRRYERLNREGGLEREIKKYAEKRGR